MASCLTFSFTSGSSNTFTRICVNNKTLSVASFAFSTISLVSEPSSIPKKKSVLLKILLIVFTYLKAKLLISSSGTFSAARNIASGTVTELLKTLLTEEFNAFSVFSIPS